MLKKIFYAQVNKYLFTKNQIYNYFGKVRILNILKKKIQLKQSIK